MTYAQRMLAFRERMGWSQGDLAKALHSSQSAISRIELGQTTEFTRARALLALFDLLEARHPAIDEVTAEPVENQP